MGHRLKALLVRCYDFTISRFQGSPPPPPSPPSRCRFWPMTALSTPHQALRAQLDAAHARIPDMIAEIRPHLRKAVQSVRMSDQDKQLRSQYIRMAGARLGHTLHHTYGSNGTAGLISLLRGLAHEQDIVHGANPSHPAGELRRAVEQAAELMPETRGLGKWPEPPLLLSPNHSAIDLSCREHFVNLTRTHSGPNGNGTRGGSSGRPASPDLFRRLGDLCYKGLPEANAFYLRQAPTHLQPAIV